MEDVGVGNELYHGIVTGLCRTTHVLEVEPVWSLGYTYQITLVGQYRCECVRYEGLIACGIVWVVGDDDVACCYATRKSLEHRTDRVTQLVLVPDVR